MRVCVFPGSQGNLYKVNESEVTDGIINTDFHFKARTEKNELDVAKDCTLIWGCNDVFSVKINLVI